MGTLKVLGWLLLASFLVEMWVCYELYKTFKLATGGF